jgi:PleD family two-component response regulator
MSTVLKPTADRAIRRKVEEIKRQKMAADKVVSLNDFRNLKKTTAIPSILVVDDDEVMRNALKRILESKGLSVILAGDGLELSKILEHSKFDLIMLDVNLPWVDGYELCTIIKDHHSLKRVPVIMVSARKTPEDIEKGFKVGANDYVTKPIEVDSVIATVQKHLQKSS